jgi:hypothetical protein
MSKCSKICEVWANGDQIGALRIAARFFDRSEDTQIFKRGMDAYNHPGFYRQLHKDPDQITAAAIQLLARKFNLTDESTVGNKPILQTVITQEALKMAANTEPGFGRANHRNTNSCA